MTQRDLNLRQRRWLELLKDYELVINYHPGKANVVADALSRNSMFTLRAMNVHLSVSFDNVLVAKLKAKLLLIHQIREAQKIDDELVAKRTECVSNVESEFQIDDNDCLKFRSRLCIPRNSKLISVILSEAHSSRMSVHPGMFDMSTSESGTSSAFGITSADHDTRMKMGSNHDRFCIWVAIVVKDPRFTSRFWKKLQEALGTKLHFSTAFHPQTDGQSEWIIQILDDMLRCCILEFSGSWERYLSLIEFAYNNSFQSSIKMAPYEALYGRKCRTPLFWTELSENKIFEVDLIKDVEGKVKVIRESLKAASDRQKSYADLKRKGIKYQIKHGVKEATWELEDTMKDRYPNLFTGKIYGDENSLCGGEL
ncbi:hypothetical protein CXB51_003745 [Gossypium anomalum]|uniref:Integrase catalytic domain-containing protein n=1 Tax=Gossypium anomalum TaxID=47600 RepID=A0A8J5ZGL4_9ROSI|nr:hypothetical protein CXB51_003745 [Gossypium anomalum]